MLNIEIKAQVRKRTRETKIADCYKYVKSLERDITGDQNRAFKLMKTDN
jgi:hypothetical protein